MPSGLSRRLIYNPPSSPAGRTTRTLSPKPRTQVRTSDSDCAVNVIRTLDTPERLVEEVRWASLQERTQFLG